MAAMQQGLDQVLAHSAVRQAQLAGNVALGQAVQVVEDKCLARLFLQDFERWKRQSPQHAAAALRMQDVINRLQALREQSVPAKAALNAAFAGHKAVTRRKQVLRALLIAGCLALPATLLLKSQYPGQWMADISTGPTTARYVHR